LGRKELTKAGREEELIGADWGAEYRIERWTALDILA